MKALLFPLVLIAGFIAGSLYGFTKSVDQVEKTVMELQYNLELSEKKEEFWRLRAEGVCEDAIYEEEPEEIFL